jgi:hypothetical protein
MSEQLTTVDGLSPREIAKATREGRLDALLKADADAIELADAQAEWREAKAAEEEAEPVPVDQGARGGPRGPKYDEMWLATTSPAEIARATRRGHLKDLLG